MTLPGEQEITCPSCGAVSSFTIFDSINVTNEPELKQMLLRRELMTFCCQDCMHEVEFEYDLLYHDMEASTMIWLKHVDEGERPVIDSTVMPRIDFIQGYRFRLVASLNQLIEKIQIFDDGYDDIVIEVFKFIACVRNQIDIATPFFYQQTQRPLLSKKQIEFAEIVESSLMKHSYTLEPTLSDAQKLANKIVDFVPRNGNWIYVDREIIVDVMQSAGLMRRAF